MLRSVLSSLICCCSPCAIGVTGNFFAPVAYQAYNGRLFVCIFHFVVVFVVLGVGYKRHIVAISFGMRTDMVRPGRWVEPFLDLFFAWGNLQLRTC
ncbi:hypothetical protein BDV12DRAFT_47562 [Aspergillus spectabilis]